MVEIPDARAKDIAAWLRAASDLSVPRQNTPMPEWADLLDPEPPSLREQVAKAWCAAYYGEFSGSAKAPDDMQMQSADAVVAVVADWLAAQPMPYPDVVTRGQRDHDVRLLRGQS